MSATLERALLVEQVSTSGAHVRLIDVPGSADTGPLPAARGRDHPRSGIPADPNGVLIDVIQPIPPSPDFAALYAETARPA